MKNTNYFRIELDNYSLAPIASFGKYYFGTLAEIRDFIDALAKDKNTADTHKSLISAFRAYENGSKDATHTVAYQEAPLLVPAQIIYSEKTEREHYTWEHRNLWGFPYIMRCDKVVADNRWVECEGRYYRAVKAAFTNLQYKVPDGHWKSIGCILWGFPHMLAGSSESFFNRLAEPEILFEDRAHMERDWQMFHHAPDLHFSEFCDDVFGDG